MTSKKPEPWAIAGIRVRCIDGPRGRDWRWRAELYADGRAVTVWSGWGTRKSLDRPDSPILAALADRSRTRGTSPAAPVMLVSDLLERWHQAQEDRADIASATKAAHRTSAQRLLGGLGTIRIAQLRDADLAAYRDAQLRKGYEPSTVAKDLRVLGAVWTFGRKVLGLDACESDAPTARVNEPEKLRRSITAAEVARILPEVPEGWRRVAVLVLFATGCRLGELHQLEVTAADLDAGVLRIRRGKANPREVPIAASVVSALRAWLSTRPTATPTLTGATYSQLARLMRSTVDPICERLGLEPLTSYAFRRGVVDALFDAGVEPKDAAAIVGHDVKTALEHYRRVPGRLHKQAAVARAGLGELPDPDAEQVIEFRRR